MKLYIDCKEDEEGSDRAISGFRHNGKYYKLDYGVPGGTCMEKEAYGCLQFVCKFRNKQFKLCCEETVVDGKVNRKYFLLK